MSRFDCPVLMHFEAFDDAPALLQVAEKHGLGGVVSKRLAFLLSEPLLRSHRLATNPAAVWIKFEYTALD